MSRRIQGQGYKWQLGDAPIGSGDAGEVYDAACVETPDLQGMVKKPARIATSGTIQRQARQIARESQALSRLNGLPKGKAHPPRLLDEAPEYTRGTANYFIVSESAVGTSLDSMLFQSRQQGKPFPRRVIITVLDALFDLFSRSHQAGVLWNDVKLDHIYWDNPTGSVTVIDWGNAIFLDQPEKDSAPIPPRWEDYRQLVETLGTFLRTSAPELYADLGWDEFTGVELDLPRISILARRIAYQREVIALQVMEYQSLIKVVLAADPGVDGLAKIKTYQQILEKIGAPWPAQEILVYSQQLLKSLSPAIKIQDCVQATALVFDIFPDENLDLAWHLLREYLRQTDILSSQRLPGLILATLNQYWPQALWSLSRIAENSKSTQWLHHLVPVLRQKALGLVSPSPFEVGQSLFEWCLSHGYPDDPLLESARFDLENWQRSGNGLDKSLLDYTSIEALTVDLDLPPNLRMRWKESYAVGKKAIRELLTAWVELDWEKIDEAFKQFFAWDPDRRGLLDLEEQLNNFHAWVQDLYEGPAPGKSATRFLISMQAALPRVHLVLGQPPWHITLTQMLTELNQEGTTSPSLQSIRTWCPWVMQRPDILEPSQQVKPRDESEIAETLSHFESHIQAWSDIEAGLEKVRERAPGYHPACMKIYQGLKETLSLNFMLDLVEEQIQETPHPSFKKSWQLLFTLKNWRWQLIQGNPDKALETLHESQLHNWQIIRHAREKTQDWINVRLPLLERILSVPLPDEQNEPQSKENPLWVILQELLLLNQNWNQIYASIIHERWLETLAESIENCREQFLNWRGEFEHPDDPMQLILYHSQLEIVRKISSKFLALTQHIRLAKLHFKEFEQSNNLFLEYQLNAAEKLIADLGALELLLVPNPAAQRVARWQSGLEQIHHTSSLEERQKVVLSLPEDHPLLPWLVEAIFQKSQ